jgi:predicted nucleic acid-binding protein
LILIDSSVLISFLRGHESAAVGRLRTLELEGTPFALPGVCYQEVLQGAKNEREWGLLGEYLGSQELLFASDPASTYREAARIFFECRRKGITIRSSIDCFIAQLALEHDAVLLHDDGDFEYIRQIRPLRTLKD